MSHGFVLVTGATGFVGRHLCAELVRTGWRVRAVYVHSGPPPNLLHPEIEWRQGSPLGSGTDWLPLLDGGITAVVHLAAIAHRITAAEQVSEQVYDQANHLGTARLAAQVAEHAATIRRFVFVSSIGAVASLAEVRLNEDSVCRPDTPYGRSKLAAEQSVQRILGASAVEWCILRPPLLYGPGNPGNMERLLHLLKLPVPLPLASVRNRRSFLYVGNLTSAVTTSLVHPAAANRVFCLSDQEEISTPELLRRLGRATGRRVRLAPFPLTGLRLVGRCGDLLQQLMGRSMGIDSAAMNKLCGSLVVDHARFRTDCGWHPPFKLDAGLTATVGPRAEPFV